MRISDWSSDVCSSDLRYLTIEHRNQILHDFSAIAEWVEIQEVSPPVRSRDPDDDMFVAAAIAGSARWLVSGDKDRSEEHTSELQSLMRISYAVFCLKKKTI